MRDTGIRRRPAQERSRDRFDRILAATASLLAERGLNQITMTDIADQAAMSLTAVYRYFPNKQSVLKELALQTFANDTATIVAVPPKPGSTADEVIAARIEEFWLRHLAEPFRLPLRAAIHADPEMSSLDLAESRRNAQLIARQFSDMTGRPDLDTLERQALLVVGLLDSLISVASRVDPSEARALVEDFKQMAISLLFHAPA